MGTIDGVPRRQDSDTELASPSGTATDAMTEALALVPDRSEALAQISRNHYAALVRFLTVRTGSVEDAKEIVQEAFAKMLALDRPGTISFLAGFLWRTAMNLAIDRRRRWVVQERYTRALSRVETREFSAEATVEARERLEIVERAIGTLPARCLEAFILHVLNGLTFDEVASQMGISQRMAQKHVARALEYVQTCLDAADETKSAR